MLKIHRKYQDDLQAKPLLCVHEENAGRSVRRLCIYRKGARLRCEVPYERDELRAGERRGIFVHQEVNPYTCRLLRRLDYALLTLRGRRPFWSNQGALCVGNGEARSYFPGPLYVLAAELQNRWPATRAVLSF